MAHTPQAMILSRSQRGLEPTPRAAEEQSFEQAAANIRPSWLPDSARTSATMRASHATAQPASFGPALPSWPAPPRRPGMEDVDDTYPTGKRAPRSKLRAGVRLLVGISLVGIALWAWLQHDRPSAPPAPAAAPPASAPPAASTGAHEPVAPRALAEPVHPSAPAVRAESSSSTEVREPRSAPRATRNGKVATPARTKPARRNAASAQLKAGAPARKLRRELPVGPVPTLRAQPAAVPSSAYAPRRTATEPIRSNPYDAPE